MPSSRSLGYDNEAAAAMYRERMRRVYISDYSVMFWLRRLFGSGCTSVYDLGGHIGIAYYADQRYLSYQEGLRWLVHDVPAVVKSGQVWAEEHDPQHRLIFSLHREDADGTDALLASGSLQYLDYTLADLLDVLARPPDHLLINLAPLHMTTAYFTV